MRAPTRAILVMVFLAVTAPALFAAPVGPTGKENAAARIEAALTGQSEVLTGLLATLPESALPAVQKALEVSQKGHDTALGVLSATGTTEQTATVSTVSPTPDVPSTPPAGLTTAREAVAAAFEKSTTTLQGLLTRFPAQALPNVEAALVKVQAQRMVALENLDQLIASPTASRPERVTPVRPDRLERPSRPERPERPEMLERPQVPERPERPERPPAPNQS